MSLMARPRSHKVSKVEGTKNATAMGLQVVSTPDGQYSAGPSILVCCGWLTPYEGPHTWAGAWALGLQGG